MKFTFLPLVKAMCSRLPEWAVLSLTAWAFWSFFVMPYFFTPTCSEELPEPQIISCMFEFPPENCLVPPPPPPKASSAFVATNLWLEDDSWIKEEVAFEDAVYPEGIQESKELWESFDDWGNEAWQDCHCTEDQQPDSVLLCPLDKEPSLLNLQEVMAQYKYPALLRDAGLIGNTVFRVLVDWEGNYVKHLTLSQVHPILTQSLESLLPQISFNAAEQNGEPVCAWVNVPFRMSWID
ncbi:MAG: hypothetical protein AAFR61_32215 [Bacteroidota bacterium]